MKKMKKALCVLMSACLLFGCCVMANAFDGPSYGDYSWAYVMVSYVDSETQEPVSKLIWGSEGPAKAYELGSFKGISYDIASNTLTLDNAKYPNYQISANEMGDDFKIKLVGNSELQCLTVWGYGWGGSLEITGKGSLNLNPEELEGIIPLKMFAESTEAKLVVGKDATLTLNVGSELEPFVYIDETSVASDPFVFKGEVNKEISVTSNEYEYLKTVPAYTGTMTETVAPYTKEGGDELYSISQVTWHTDPDDFDVTEDHVYIYTLIPCDKVDCGYLMVLKEDLLQSEIPSEYTPVCDMEITAIDTSSVSGGSNCEVVVDLDTGDEYVVMSKWIDSGFENYLAEIVGEIERNGKPAYFVVEIENSPTWARGDELPDKYDYATEGGSGYYYHILCADGQTLVIGEKSNSAPAGSADVNGDSDITIADAKWTLQAVADTRGLTDAQRAAADVNGDGDVTIVDAKWILQIVAGLRDPDTHKLK